MAWLYDPEGEIDLRLNSETVIAVPVESAAWEARLRELIERHARETGSPRAAEILRHWSEELPRFRQIVPKEMLSRLPHPLSDREEAVTA
jgi:glutamate synthase domain-containing protein 3